MQWDGCKNSESSNVASLNLRPVISLPGSNLDLDPRLQEEINRAREDLIFWRNHAKTELAEAEEHNQSIFLRKVESRNRKLDQLEAFEKLRIGQFVVYKSSSPKRGKILSMEIVNSERLELQIEWESGRKAVVPFLDIVPEQMS